jgi:hypothetical protein
MGGVVEGSFRSGFPNGLCKFTARNGSVYYGNVCAGHFEELGLCYSAHANRWRVGKFNDGEEIMTVAEGSGRPVNLGNVG